MKTRLEEALLAARDKGSAETDVVSDGRPIKVRIVSETEAITVSIKAPETHLQEDVIIAVLGILGHPPDAVYHVCREGSEAQTMEAVWAHPGKDFEDELRPVVKQITARGHRMLMVSDRLYRYLVPNHPDDWDETRVRAWQDFWNLRLRDAAFREWVQKYTDPKVWDYFRVIANSVNQNMAEEHDVLGDLPGAIREQMENLFLSAAVSGLHLCYLHRRQQNLPLVSTDGNVDPERMTAQVLTKLSWENIPGGLAEVVNEINITDIRQSGELFIQAVQMPPEILNTLLSEANKCSVLGFVTGDTVQGVSDLN